LFLLIISNLYAQKLSISKIIWKGAEVEVSKDHIMVGLKPNYNKSDLSQSIISLGFSIDQNPDVLNIARLKVPSNVKSLSEYIDELKQLEIFRFIEPDFVDHISVIPNDDNYDDQWAYPKVDAPSAWNISTGSNSIVIGVLDTGIPIQSGSLSHPDLNDASKIIIGNDYVGDGNGVMDENGHGTHVAGIIGAETNNSTGVAGMTWGCLLRIYQVFDKDGDGSHSRFKNAVINAVDNGCKVLNYSGGGSASSTKEDAVAYAYNNDVILISSAGNDYRGNVVYPAAYSTSYNNVVAVSSTTSSDNIADYSNSGPEINVSAPGSSIYSTMPNYPVTMTIEEGYNEDYDYDSGTSMAAPYVTGLAGLIKSFNSSLTPSQIRNTIQISADDKGTAGFDTLYGHGRINANNAVRNLYVPEVYSTISSALSIATAGQKVIVKEGTHYIGSNVTVPSGVTLEIKPDAIIKTSSNKQITINGTLNAIGTSIDLISFDRNGSSGSWGGISFGSSSDGNLQYCTFKHANTAISRSGTGPYTLIKNCTFEDNFSKQNAYAFY